MAAGASALEQRFEVRRSDRGETRRVMVQFVPQVAEELTEEVGRPLDDDQAFWVRQAALALAGHVWNHADVPAGDRLVVDRLSDDVIKAARQQR
jgi:hypothetical protein